MKPLFEHQRVMADFAVAHNAVFNMSDPGTGKTRGTLEGFRRRREEGRATRLLVVCPLSIIESSWGDDIKEFTDFRYAVAWRKNNTRAARQQAFESDADIVLLNHDGVKHIDFAWAQGFTDLAIDESTAYRNRGSDRSKAVLKLSLSFDHITLMTGTPSPNTVQDIWHQAFILDHGKRLGKRFFAFRQEVCTPVQVGPSPEHIKWEDKIGAEEMVSDALSDISLRFKMEDCIDIPEHVVHYYHVDMPKEVMRAYREMEKDASIVTAKGPVTAIHAGAKVKKMLQILSGSVYDTSGEAHAIHNDRYELVMQLVDERKHSLVAFNWTHERDALIKLAEKKKISYAVIDGDASVKDREQAVKDFEAGKLRVLFCQPQSAAHGLTLVKGTATIWCSATYNLEHFSQMNRRIYRAGQTQKTETICIAARNTKETEVYEKLQKKETRMSDLLSLFAYQTAEVA